MIHNFQKNIFHNGALMGFMFEPLHNNDKSTFVVHCSYLGESYLFHMQIDLINYNDMTILDKHNCPADVIKLEKVLSQTIKSHCN